MTNGHLDLVRRAARLFDRVVVAVARSDEKNPLLSQSERLELVRASIGSMKNVTAEAFDGLLINYVRQRGGQAVMRGLRAVSDFEFEFQLALLNRRLNERIETVFMMPKEEYTFLSSRMVKEIARLGGDVTPFVPAHVVKALARQFALARKAAGLNPKAESVHVATH
jgi:pantetheine-phosphate adenylyltransferase